MTPEQRRTKRERVQAWGLIALGCVAFGWAVKTGEWVHYLVALVCFGAADPVALIAAGRK